MEIYNDLWIKGQIITSGVRVSEPRYNAISPIMDRYERPFTVLDLGPSTGYFSFMAASMFPQSVVVAIGDQDITAYCEMNELHNLMFLHHHLSVEDLEWLATCEHFDVVLALNILHHFGGDSERALRAVIQMGTDIIIETPDIADKGACGQGAVATVYNLVAWDTESVIGRFPSHTDSTPRLMLAVHLGDVSGISRPFFHCPSGAWTDAVIMSTYTTKSVKFASKPEEREWIPGINLQTFWELGGQYPAKSSVIQWVRDFPLPTERHGDIRPWNFIIDGRGIHLIDGRDAKANFDDAEGKAETLRLLEGK